MSITSKNIFPWQSQINKAKRFQPLHKGILKFFSCWPCGQPKNTRQALTPRHGPSPCVRPCQLVKVAFMACHCFLYDSDYVWERSADETMWGQRKPKGGNLKTTPPSEIFTTTAQGVQERKSEWRGGNQRKEEESEGKVNESCKRSKRRGESRRGTVVFIFTNDSVSILMNNWTDGLRLVKYSHLSLNISAVLRVCVSSVWNTLLYIVTHTTFWCSKYSHKQTCKHTPRSFCDDHPSHTHALFVCVHARLHSGDLSGHYELIRHE